MRVFVLSAGLLLIASCGDEFTAPAGSYPVPATYVTAIAEGHAIARACYQMHEGKALPGELSDVELWIVPGATFDHHGRSSEAVDLPAAGSYYDGRIYIAYRFRDFATLWAHEFLHAFGGFRDHPPIFAACGL